jgi:hypothetical protein
MLLDRDRMLPRSLFIVLPLLFAACDRAPDAPPAKPVAAACVSRPEGSRWAGDYRETARFGDTDDEALGGIMLGGIAATERGVYVLETQASSLWLLRPDLTFIRRIGRDGEGPGEWRFLGWETHGGSMRWVSASDDHVRIFDRTRIQEFNPDGRFRRVVLNEAAKAGISFMQSRIVHLGDTLFYSSGGYDIMPGWIRREGKGRPGTLREVVDGRYPWTIRMRANEEDRPLVQVGLARLTNERRGLGPAHARPLWDSNGGCVVVSNGADPMLVYAPVGGRQDTLAVPVPDRVERAADYAGMMGGLGLPDGRMEEPASPTRIRDLVLDPDGWVWLETVRPRDRAFRGVEVVRVPLGGGEAVLDTVPAFPRAFGVPGVYYAEINGPDNENLVTRYDLTSQPGV